MVMGSSHRTDDSGVGAGNRAVRLMRHVVHSTYDRQVIAGMDGFGGLFDAAALKGMRKPVLVSSTDGIGPKVKLAAQAHRYRSIGHDIVNHCINDILVRGARPLFFMHYLGSSLIEPNVVAEVVTGIAIACREAGCALLGGETSEVRGVYSPDSFDVAGTIVGFVERASILPRADLRAGDLLIGLGSSGPHTSGFSLIRRVFEGIPLEMVFPELGIPLAEVLLAPHRSYFPILQHAMSHVKALAHLTGGGFFENLPRVLPSGLSAHVRLGTWPVPSLFELIELQGKVPPDEMYHVFNMGIGMVAVVAPENAEPLQVELGEPSWVIGELVTGDRTVILDPDPREARTEETGGDI